MKSSKLALASVGAALLASLTVSAKNEMKKAYMFGIAASFNDSTVYFTPVQEVDSVWFTKRNKTVFLQNRDNYSYQLRDFLEQKGESNRTCAIFFGTSHKKVEDKWEKVHAKYTAKSKKKKKAPKGGEKPPYQVKMIDNGEFLFKPIAPTEETQVEKPAKKARKEKPGRPGGPGKPGGGPGGPGGGPGGQPPMGGGM